MAYSTGKYDLILCGKFSFLGGDLEEIVRDIMLT